MNSESQSNCPSVSVVIPTKNGGDLFKDVLNGLTSQVYSGMIELIVVDSGSSDQTIYHAQKAGAKVHSIAPETFNHGLTRNFGISQTTGEVIILMTQDAVPADTHLIDSLVAGFNLADNVAGVYAKQIPRSNADVLTCRNLNSWLTARSEVEVRYLESEADYDTKSPIEKYFFCNFDNVCSAVSRLAWESLPFEENDFGEDIEWCRRALLGGWKIVYQPQSIVVHSHDRSLAYEYKRTYVCHRKLYQLFNLRCVPSFKHAVNSIIKATLIDWRYVSIHEHRLLQKLRLLLKVPGLSFASVMGQYHGAKDELQQQRKEVKGV